MLDELQRRPLIPVIVLDDAASAVPLAGALLEGGLDVIEITFRTAAAAEAVERIRTAFPEMLVGAGTILTTTEAARALDAGVGFGLAPGLNPAVVAHFQEHDTLFIPGVMTPSEIEQAMALGCRLLKFFPAEAAGGVGFLKSLAGPYASRGVRFCPTGGIGPENMADYLSLPIVANIGGSWLATRDQIADGDWPAITARVEAALAAVPQG